MYYNMISHNTMQYHIIYYNVRNAVDGHYCERAGNDTRSRAQADARRETDPETGAATAATTVLQHLRITTIVLLTIQYLSTQQQQQ